MNDFAKWLREMCVIAEQVMNSSLCTEYAIGCRDAYKHALAELESRQKPREKDGFQISITLHCSEYEDLCKLVRDWIEIRLDTDSAISLQIDRIDLVQKGKNR